MTSKTGTKAPKPEKQKSNSLGPTDRAGEGVSIEMVEQVLARIKELLQEANALEKAYVADIEKVHVKYQESSKNLLHYLALRKHDNRHLQAQLASLGLSSLGRLEAHVQTTLYTVRNQLLLLQGHLTGKKADLSTVPAAAGSLKTHISELFGPASPGRDGRIMVTFSTDLAEDYKAVRALMKAGMNCARINCAHDDITVWEKMAANIRKAEQELNQSCKILFDLMGPKLRTGLLKAGPKVLAIHPKIDEVGQILSVAKVWLGPKGVPAPEPVDAAIRVSKKWAKQAEEGSRITFKDTRKRKRLFTVVQKVNGGLLVVSGKSAYLATGTELQLVTKTGEVLIQKIGELPAMTLPLLLKNGQELILHRKSIPGEPAQLDSEGNQVEPAHISCTLPEVFSRVKAGEPIWFDDGEIEGVIEEVNPEYLRVKITAADELGAKLKPDKGINLPESDLQLHKLTVKDRQDLAHVLPFADIINLSFVSHPPMVEELQQALQELQAKEVGIMLKIETKAAFDNLPHLLLTLLRQQPAGLMIARGDLAVELGWQRLAEVQEEILWIAEAAHLPVVWATQVLEKLTKKGRPSRAEITDAAMAQRADCVMLNKGAYILKSLELLNDIMQRMQEHQYKKTALLRKLHVSDLIKN
ncbi:pyruvate kinase [Nibribacter ruber]|uniref:pyruvate kinase n=1 Tax=Nibribacter ruber TaxID=2698458 RepID=A0A6P1NRZ0_9BACT|nr:pyruvate kinase [Nibribacter ruber]QHL86596.1 pyruvate kinase [Nibribacter ruber]